MGIMDEKLWKILRNKSEEYDYDLRSDQKISDEYIAAVKYICNYGIDRAKTIRDNFPMFTLHDESHICNVMRLMTELLGDNIDNLSRDEAAMLVLAACFHDIGMSYSEKDKEDLFTDIDRLNKYLDNNKGEYVRAFSKGDDIPHMTDDMIQNYLRSIHHERIVELSYIIDWPSILEGKIDRQDFIAVCQSHGRDISVLDVMEQTATVDLRFCSIILRLSDILDFDTIRAPKAVYEYCSFDDKNSFSAMKSREEWEKHMSSHGFNFKNILDRSYPYNLDYSATCKSMQVEQAINTYLDWVDLELINCNKQISRFTGKWQKFVLPIKIKRSIRAEGYVSGQYHLTLDQNQIMELLIGKELYSDPSVFVRELIQNAIDAVRTREQLDKNLPIDWKAQINIRCWMDEEGYHWFRIEDNGIGMTEEIIMNFFLKIGSSYYNSDTFLQAKIRCKADSNYTPISRFGIGILSCFMGDEQTNRVEVSTKRFNESLTYYPALRLSMNGMNGYYYLANKDMNHIPGPMKGTTNKEKEQYLKQAGTVIAVRSNLYQNGKYKGFKEIIDKYVIYPSVSIHYDGPEGAFDYPTESEFMKEIHNAASSCDKDENGILEISLSEDQLTELYSSRPELSFNDPPKVIIKCIALDNLTESPYLKGATITVKGIGFHKPISVDIGGKKENLDVNIHTNTRDGKVYLVISLDFFEDSLTRMRALEAKHENVQRIDDSLNANDLFYNDDISNEVYSAIKSNYIAEPEWINYMKKRHAISSKILNNYIKEIQNKIYDNYGINCLKLEEYKVLRSFKEMERKWKFLLCDLNDFDWYTKYFNHTYISTNLYNVVAHNGIFCGDAHFFSKTGWKSDSVGTILLLRDKYRPNVDVAREGVRMLTLEALSDMEMIKKNIYNQGFELLYNNWNVYKELFSDIPMAEYLNLLNERPDLLKQLTFRANKELYCLEELEQLILRNDTVELQDFPLLYSKVRYSTDERIKLCAYLSAAYLRKNYSLRVSFKSYPSRIFVINEKENLLTEYTSIFPPNFFITPLEEECTYLTSESAYFRNACNAKHPLSDFLIANCQSLKQYMPGVFKELLRSLSEDEKLDLIKNINEMLDHLRNLPGNLIKVPNTLILTENDLI